MSDKYVLVKATDVKPGVLIQSNDEKEKKSDKKDQVLPMVRPVAALRNRMKAGAKGGKKIGKLNPITTWCILRGTANGATATAYNTVINIEPDNTDEWSSFSALYDEVKVDEVKMQFAVMRSAGAAGDTLMSLGGFAYDPLDSGVYGSIQALAAASQHFLFVLPQTPSTAIYMTPTPTSRDGYYHWKMKMPPGGQLESSGAVDSNVVTGFWSSTNQSNQRYGFIKPYWESGATGVSWTCSYVLFYKLSFRSRT